MGKTQSFVYGNFGGLNPCILKVETAERLAAQGDVISQSHSGSFGGFIERCRSHPAVFDADWVDEIAEFLDDGPLTIDQPFSVDLVPGYDDGWFPGDARTAMIDDMPEEVTESGIGEIFDHGIALPLYLIDDADIPGIRAVLEGLGHTVRHDQELFDRMEVG